MARTTLKRRRVLRLLTVRGELDRSTAAALAEATRETGVPGNSTLVLDFAQVTFIDGGGLALLYDLVERCRDQEWVGILAPPPNMRRILEIAGLTAHRALRVFGTKEEALTALGYVCA